MPTRNFNCYTYLSAAEDRYKHRYYTPSSICAWSPTTSTINWDTYHPVEAYQTAYPYLEVKLKNAKGYPDEELDGESEELDKFLEEFAQSEVC